MKENKTEKQPETAKKNEPQPLTPEEIRKRRKMLVYPLLFLVFGVAMWLIFEPSDEGESLPDGFNVKEPAFGQACRLRTAGFRAQAAGEDEHPAGLGGGGG